MALRVAWTNSRGMALPTAAGHEGYVLLPAVSQYGLQGATKGEMPCMHIPRLWASSVRANVALGPQAA